MDFRNGDQLYFQTELTWKTFFTFPVRFIIQLSGRQKILVNDKEYSFEHGAIHIRDYSYEAVGQAFWDKKKKGTIKTHIKKRLSVNSKYTKIIILRLKTPLTEEECDLLVKDYEAHLGKKFSISQAVMSWVENILPEKLRRKYFKEAKLKEFFCIKYMNMGLYNIGRTETLPRTLTPNESFKHWVNKCEIIEYN